MADVANQRETNGLNKTVVMLLSFLALFALWVLLSFVIGDDDILPDPVSVWRAGISQFNNGELIFHTSATLARVAAAFGLAMLVGTIIGILLGLFQKLDRWADPWVIFFLNLPALVVIVLCYLWIGLNEVAAIIAVSFNKTAMVIVTIREGVRVMDPAISDMSTVYRFSLLKRFRHVWMPQIVPFVLTGVRNGLAVIWKIVLVVEFLGRPNGVGFQIHLYFQLFDIANVLAYSLTFIAIMLFIERCIVQPLENRANYWRRKVSN